MIIFAAIRLVKEDEQRARDSWAHASRQKIELPAAHAAGKSCSCAPGLSAAHRNRLQIELIRQEITQHADK